MRVARITLPILDDRIRARVEALEAEHPAWPCGDGCSHCCRSLPSLPRVSAPEWARLKGAIDALAPEVQRAVLDAIGRPSVTEGRVTCPMLSPSGSCGVYAARPVACRTYGFYTERDAGLHCQLVLDALAPELDGIVWGNGEALGRDLDALGPRRPLDEWLALD